MDHSQALVPSLQAVPLMGLDTTHDAWHGPYGSFSRWRHALAVAAGIIEEGENLYSDPTPIEWDSVGTDYMGRWEKDPEDVIWVLLAHSDCEGEIKKRFLLPLADRLEGLLPKLEADGCTYEFSSHGKATQFIQGLRLAASENKKVKFH